MRVLAFKPGHDGAIAVVEDGKLILSFEGEKGSFPRYSPIWPHNFLDVGAGIGPVDCIAIGGWPKGFYSSDIQYGSGYFGLDEESYLGTQEFFGREVRIFHGTHEASHVWSAYSMSDVPVGSPCYVLVWEGNIGKFYYIDESLAVTAFPTVLEDVGNKYAFMFSLADPGFDDARSDFRFEDAGKQMALAAFGETRGPSEAENEIISWVINHPKIAGSKAKQDLADSEFYNVGVESQVYKDLARQMTNRIFDIFRIWAESNLQQGLPLVINGGCGLNCEWNSRWIESGLFSSVFVPPTTNDSGSAIGTAAEALRALSCAPKLSWDVYCGSRPRDRLSEFRDLGLTPETLNPSIVAEHVAAGNVVPVMNGRCEIGPRALGNRSLIADPRTALSLETLNKIKNRESYRPIAPAVTDEYASEYFDLRGVDRYMLYFSKVKTSNLPAVTHVDGSARVQMVSKASNAHFHDLISAFGELTGVHCLCNTSLNFKGKGFIDSVDELVKFCREHDLRYAIVDGYYLKLD